MILAIETATEVCSVAFQNEEGAVYGKRIQGRSVHADSLFLFTQQLMEDHQFKLTDLKAVLVSNGPGSYTGLRIAASAVKGLLFGTSVDLFAVNTLAGFAEGVREENGDHTIHAIIDARRTHVYHEAFWCENDRLYSKSKPVVMEIAAFETKLQHGDVIVGTGAARLSSKKLASVKVFGSDSISAESLIELFNNQPDAPFFMKTTPGDLDPEYITSNQVNNTWGQ